MAGARKPPKQAYFNEIGPFLGASSLSGLLLEF